MKTAKIPEVTIMRLTTYSRYLLHLKESGKKITSSREIAAITGSTSSQVRKDFAYYGFGDRGFHTAAIFDADKNKIGTEIGGLVVEDIKNFKDITKKEKIDIAVIVVPADKAQKVGDIVVDSGIKAILNFAPIVLNAPQDVEVRNVDFSIYLEILSYNMLVKGL